MISSIPRPIRRSWDVAYKAWELSNTRHLGLIAAGVAFFCVLAIFPSLAALVAIWGFFADPHVVSSNMASLEDFLPRDAFNLLNDQVEGLVNAGSGTLGWATLISVLAALWSSRAGMSALVQGLNATFGEEVRGGIAHQVVALLLTLSMVGTAIVALAAGIVLPIALEHLWLGPFEEYLSWVASLPIAPVATVTGVALVYRYGANPHGGQRPPFFSIGLFVAVALWLLASEGFAFYLTNFGNYNKVYGSIGAVAALLMWVYLSAWAVLMGAAVNAALDQPEPEVQKTSEGAEAAPASAVLPEQSPPMS